MASRFPTETRFLSCQEVQMYSSSLDCGLIQGCDRSSRRGGESPDKYSWEFGKKQKWNKTLHPCD